MRNTQVKRSGATRGLFVGFAGFLLCTAMFGCGSASTPEDVAEKAGQAYVSQDVKAYYDLLAPGYADYVAGSDGWYETEEEFEEEVIATNMRDLHDEFEDICGGDYAVTVKTRTTKTCEDEAVLDDVRNELSSNFYYESEDIQDAAEVEIYYRVTGNGTGDEFVQTLNCVKVGGGWYIHQPEIDAL